MTNHELITYDKRMTCDLCSLNTDMSGKRKLFIRAVNHAVAEHARTVIELQEKEGDEEGIDPSLSFLEACQVFAGRHCNIITKQTWDVL